MTTTIDKVIYTARSHTEGGRDGQGRSDDGLLDVRLDPPASMGGKGTGTNPEQLFAVGYAACFLGALKAVADKQKVELPHDRSINSEVDIGPTAKGFGIAVRMKISLPGMERAQAQALVDAAHAICPYSNATRGNIPVELTLA